VFDWLFEGRAVVYALLAAVAGVLLILWWMHRKRNLLIAVGVVAGLAGLYFLLDRLVETPREQIERKVGEMAAAVKARDAGTIAKHLAADFRFHGQDRDSFRKFVESAVNRGVLDELTVWDMEWPEEGDDRTRRVQFKAKPKGGMAAGIEYYYLVKARFVREADGQWRLKDFDVYNPFVDSNRPLDIPNLP
jgi:hypothetical protein